MVDTISNPQPASTLRHIIGGVYDYQSALSAHAAAYVFLHIVPGNVLRGLPSVAELLRNKLAHAAAFNGNGPAPRAIIA